MEQPMSTEAKRGPGRPRRVEAVELAPLASQTAWKRVKITVHKVYTPHGRFIEGQFAVLPEDLADALIAEGKAK